MFAHALIMADNGAAARGRAGGGGALSPGGTIRTMVRDGDVRSGGRWKGENGAGEHRTGAGRRRDLGATLMHEHVFVLSPEIEKTSAEWDEEAVQATAVPPAAS